MSKGDNSDDVVFWLCVAFGLVLLLGPVLS